MTIGCNSNDFNKYVLLISELKELGIEDKWQKIKKEDGLEFDYPNTLIPRMEKLIEEEKKINKG